MFSHEALIGGDPIWRFSEKAPPTRWAPEPRYKWSHNLYKWPYKWVTGVRTPISGVLKWIIYYILSDEYMRSVTKGIWPFQQNYLNDFGLYMIVPIWGVEGTAKLSHTCFWSKPHHLSSVVLHKSCLSIHLSQSILIMKISWIIIYYPRKCTSTKRLAPW